MPAVYFFLACIRPTKPRAVNIIVRLPFTEVAFISVGRKEQNRSIRGNSRVGLIEARVDQSAQVRGGSAFAVLPGRNPYVKTPESALAVGGKKEILIVI